MCNVLDQNCIILSRLFIMCESLNYSGSEKNAKFKCVEVITPYTHTCMHTNTNSYVELNNSMWHSKETLLCMPAYIHAYTFICTYMHIYTYLQIHTHIYIYIRVYIYIYIYICIYLYTYTHTHTHTQNIQLESKPGHTIYKPAYKTDVNLCII